MDLNQVKVERINRERLLKKIISQGWKNKPERTIEKKTLFREKIVSLTVYSQGENLKKHSD